MIFRVLEYNRTLSVLLSVLQEREEVFQQKTDAHSLDLSSLTLKEPPSPVEELVTNINSAKVNFKMPFEQYQNISLFSLL